ncbi:hypothetical protein RJ640_017804 [Escallonia rubra]|uniref:Phosphatidylinositol-glycan biosynthesis class X protein n=1 Tax=Escallonia rubra TaxID=112253 RepID=A0AA88QZN6_9ASTE|nr:hypothetical protein RJ640_008098 [Escallonia rubra]KAK2991973.1 hypothetical protein RJ640_017804 [Escallonia rubra]
MGIQQFKLQVSLRLGIALYFFASISCCKHASTINEVGSCTSNLDDSNPSSSALHGVNEFITEAYFEKHASLIDSDFQRFLSKEIPLEFCEVLQDKLEPVPKLSISHRHLIGEGSHRRLSSSIRLEIQPGSKFTLPAHFCDAIVVEILPSGVFADPFELQHLLQRGVFTGAAVFGDTNLELPSVRSNRSIVEIHMDIGPNVLSGNNNGLEINIEVPLHARYAPLGEHEFSRVEFSPPDLFTRCSFEGKSHKQSCIFLSTNKSLELKAGAVVWDVPCGIKEHTGIVSVVTFFSAIVSALLIVFTAFHYSDTTGCNNLKQM